MSVSLRNSSQYKASSLSGIRKIVIGFLVLSAFLLLLLSSSPFLLKSNADTLASKLNNNHRDNSILSTHDDMDGDGLSDVLEGQLGTLANDKYGDKDSDGLYDFEEYLDYYGNNDTTDGRKYKYNDSTTFNDADGEAILDIYHYFNFSKNGTGFLRDESSDGQRSGFTNHLLWNVTFSADYAGGRDGFNDVLYLNNTIVGCTFSGQTSGGSQGGMTNYTNNVVLDTQFTGAYSGGNEYGGNTGDPPALHYKNNTFTNVIFSQERAGGSASSDAGNLYSLNTFTNVNFTAIAAGGSFTGPVTYGNNSFTSVIFSGSYAGFSENVITTYGNNTFDRVRFSGTQNINLAKFSSGNNTIVENGDTYDSDGDTLNDLHELLTLGTNPSKLDTDGDSLNDSYEIGLMLNASNPDTDGDEFPDAWELKFNGSFGLNPREKAPEGTNFSSDTDRDGLNISLEGKALTSPEDNDTDGDGLLDGEEYLNLTTDPTLADTDMDGLSDSEEPTYKTDPIKPDTDRDGLLDGDEVDRGLNATSADTDGDDLLDGWEVKYESVEYVDPLDEVTSAQLASDTDGDRLNLSEEAKVGTNPGDPDTDGDGLGDGWEVRYYMEVNIGYLDPLRKETDNELRFDTDKDGLNTSLEAKAFTHPDKSDTDGDGLNDSYEFLVLGTDGTLTDTDGDGLNDSYEVLTLGTNAALADTDGDGLNDSYEFLTLGTNATLADTDGDGLGDGWEVKYNGTSGVNPLVAATDSELASDTDNDGLSLLEEFKANLDPGTADNPMQMSTASDSSSSGEITVDSSFALLVVLAIFTSFSLVFVVYRIRRRML